jgi:hypothetical protein
MGSPLSGQRISNTAFQPCQSLRRPATAFRGNRDLGGGSLGEVVDEGPKDIGPSDESRQLTVLLHHG